MFVLGGSCPGGLLSWDCPWTPESIELMKSMKTALLVFMGRKNASKLFNFSDTNSDKMNKMLRFVLLRCLCSVSLQWTGIIFGSRWARLLLMTCHCQRARHVRLTLYTTVAITVPHRTIWSYTLAEKLDLCIKSGIEKVGVSNSLSPCFCAICEHFAFFVSVWALV